MREKYWVMMTQRKFHIIYLGHHLHRNVQVERWINYVLAVVSTGSLAGFVFFQDHQRVLGIILAITQVVSAVRPYFPYYNRINELDKGITMLNMVYYDIEKTWNEINIVGVDDSDINDKYYNYMKKWDEVDNEILKKDSLPRKNRFVKLAEMENHRYFNNLFGGD